MYSLGIMSLRLCISSRFRHIFSVIIVTYKHAQFRCDIRWIKDGVITWILGVGFRLMLSYSPYNFTLISIKTYLLLSSNSYSLHSFRAWRHFGTAWYAWSSLAKNRFPASWSHAPNGKKLLVLDVVNWALSYSLSYSLIN